MAAGPSAAPTRPRRTQARSLVTRRRLLDAAIDCLVECGVAGTTTPEVCRRAGVSQGALFKHFGSKAQLLAATAEHLFAGLVDGFRREFAAAGHDADPQQRLAEALQVLRRSFQEPRLLAAFELYAVARTDPALRSALGPVLEAHRDNLRAEARQLLPEWAGELDGPLDMVMAAFQGAALGGLVAADPIGDARVVAFVERSVRRELADV